MSKKLNLLFLALTVLATLFIFSNSMRTATSSSTESGYIIDIIVRFIHVQPENITYIVRKSAHIFEFFMQGIFAGLALLFSHKFLKNIIYILFTGLLTACTDEFIQLFFEGRAGLVSDIFIDFIGTIMAVVFSLIIYAVFFKAKKN